MKRMKQWVWLAVLGTLLAGCTMSSQPQGVSVTLLRDAMVESAQVADASENPEGAVRAVRVWRDAGDDAAGDQPAGITLPGAR